MHEIQIGQARYLVEDAVATSVFAVAESVATNGLPVTVEFPIIPRSKPEDWGVASYVRAMILPDSAVSIEPSTALEFSPGDVQTIRVHPEFDARFRRSREAGLESEFIEDELDDLGYDLL